MKEPYIGAKLGIAFALLVSVLAGAGWLAMRRVSELNRDMKQTIDDHWAKVQIASEALSYSNLNNRITMQVFLLDDREEIDELLIRRAQNSEKISTLLGQLQARTGSERERELLSAVKAARTPYVESYKKHVNMLLNEKRGPEARNAMVRVTLPFLLRYHAAWNDFVRFQKEEMDWHIKEGESRLAATRVLVQYLIAAIILFVMVAGILLTRFTIAEISRREEVENEVWKLNEELEGKVQERTVALARSNQDLATEVAEHREAEEKLLQAKQAAETASYSKSQFLANMSHEIRTPINGILGMAELTLDTELAPEQREYLLMIKSSGDSLLRVINDILDFSKIEAGKLDLDPIDFNLHDNVMETTKAMAVRAHQKGLELVTEILPEVPQQVVGDAGRLRQVLVNLVGNAIKFTQQGEVLVRVERIASEGSGLQLKFTISDTGIGIAREKQSLIFEAFAQADNGMSRSYEGTGLGLAIASRLIGMMEGKIWLQSTPGEGSTFFFTVSLGISRSARAAPVSTLRADLLHVPVLVVDDNATNRRLLVNITENWGMQASAVSSGSGALEVMERAQNAGKSFRLALIDSQMPAMDGFELAERIRQNPALAGAMIMMLTSAGRPGDAARCRELGIAAYLLKPIRKTELLAAILQVLGHARDTKPNLVTRHALREARRHLRILLAEDNPINQKVLLGMLQKIGHRAVIAATGLEAIASLKRETFDVVFMDVQMPEMDGLTATAKIREQEKKSGAHIPIIAMTAHAMKGDRERCLDSGMDAYLAKPITSEQIADVLDKLFGLQDTCGFGRSADWSSAAVLERVNGDQKVLRDILEIFLDEYPKFLSQMHQALDGTKPELLQEAARKLESELTYLGAMDIAAAAQRIEEFGRNRNLQDASDALEAFERQLSRLALRVRDEVRASSAMPAAPSATV
jgi:two-component system, sensor histidine kinase and response regulator